MILGILAAVAIPIFNGIQDKAEGIGYAVTAAGTVLADTDAASAAANVTGICVTGTKAGVPGEGITGGAYKAGSDC